MLQSRCWSFVLLVFIAGCVAKAPAPVIDKSRQSDYAYTENQSACQAETQEEFCHVVERGDTLYAISRRYGLKVVEIASRNAITAPYIIRPGELLVVRQGNEPVSTETPAVPSRVAPTAEPVSPPLATQAIPKATTVTPSTTQSPKPAISEPSATPSQQVASSTSNASTSAAPMPPVKMVLRTTRTKSGWQWPVPYEPIANEDEKGLEYLLADDTEVVAAISGKVIYAGAGLNKYRHLIIVDSATSHLVAYEFNTAHDISEGQSIGRGDTITRIKRSSDDRSADSVRYRHFRFEIWANGKPLNPDRVISVAARN